MLLWLMIMPKQKKCQWIKVRGTPVWNLKKSGKWTRKQISVAPYRDLKGNIKYVYQTATRVLGENLSRKEAIKLAKKLIKTTC